MERQAIAKTQKHVPHAHVPRQSTGPSSPALHLVSLQSSIGNQAMRRLINSPYIQTKLEVSKPGDPFEQEADRVADSVMQRVEPRATSGESSQVKSPPATSQITRSIQRHTPPLAVREEEDEREEDEVQSKPLFRSAIQRLCTECEEEKEDTEVKPAEMVQRKSESSELQASSDLQQKLNSSKGSGTALPDDTRSSFESALGADFSGVQVHTGAAAVEMNKSLGAHAFTHGSDIYFNAGKYDPSSSAGKHLLAHELTHTVQQGSALRTKKQTGGSDAGHLTTTAPSIQASWYNFDIPFTDYQFDPSLQGIKNAAGIVKDTAVAGVEWIVDEIKSLISSGIDWLTEKWNALKEFASSAFDAVKKSFTDILAFIQSPLSFIANAIMTFDTQSLVAAWAGFTEFISGVGKGFKAATDHLFEQINEVWGGISDFATSLLNKVTGLTKNFLFNKLPDALQQIAHAVINQLKSLWKSINDGWTRVFNQIKTWVDNALETVLEFVNRILSFAMDVVIEGIRQFGELVLFLKDLYANPKKYLDILAAKSIAAFEGVEGYFSGLVAGYFPQAEQASNDTAVTGTIQRQADPAAAPEAKSSATWSDIGAGVLQMMGKKWDEFKANPWSIVTGLLLDMFFPIYGNVKDVIELFGEIKKIVTGPLSAGSLEEFWTSFLLILDIPILIYQKVVSILMRSLMVPLIVASFIPHPLVKGIAAAVGYALLGAFVQGELMNVGQKVLLLTTGKLTQDQKADAYNRIADTIIAIAMTAAIMLIMLILHFIANIMKGIYNFVKGKVFPVEKASAKVKGPAEGKGKGGPEEGKAAEGKGTKEVSTKDGKRKMKINEEGKCEVCASPCDDVRKKYGSVMTPEAEAKIKAIENDAALSDAQKIEKLKPVEQELADLTKQRSERLSKDPQTGKENPKSIEEKDAILQAEKEGHVQKPERPDLAKGDPNLDFKVEGPPPFKFADVKTPVNRGNLTTQAEGIGKKITLQKAGASDVLHVVDLKNIPAAEKPAFKATVLKEAGSPTGIVFIN